MRHSDNEFVLGNNYINGIKNFWGLCKLDLLSLEVCINIPFNLHIKECELRYQKLYLILLKNFRVNSRKLS